MDERRQDNYEEEERIGLLGEKDHDENGSQKLDFEEVDLSEPNRASRLRWNSTWFRTVVITLLIAWTLGFIIHSFLVPHKNELTSITPARLRPEKDYILNPKWDLNAKPTTREYHWTIAEHDLNPDGVYRQMILFNDMFPGPLIECNEGDEIVVHVHNEATNATSIHWHGLYQNGTNWMDGTVGVTQCPIAPGKSFSYRFNVSGQTGTYFYHSHMSMQASDGLVGPIVIHAKGEEEEKLQKVPYGEDRIVLVSDNYYNISSSLLVQYLAPDSNNHEPVPHSGLINGRGTRDCRELRNRRCTSNDTSNALFDLASDQNTRLRIINVGAFAEFQFQIDEHELLLTEVDGVDVWPQQIHRVTLQPAQRYSVVIIPPDPNDGLYWMRARMNTHCFKYEEPELKAEVRGVVRYWSAGDDTEPESKDWHEMPEVKCKDLDTKKIEPVKEMPAPAKANDLIVLRSSFFPDDRGLSRGYLNDNSFRADIQNPTLNSFMSSYSLDTTAYNSSMSRPYGFNGDNFDEKHAYTYQTTGIRVIDILIQNHDIGNHPFHLHGHTFWVLASGSTMMQQSPTELYYNLNLTNPLRRDTVNVDAMGWTLIRFVADNPGVWAFHCHIGWHAEAGLMMQFLTRADEVVKQTLPMETGDLCAAEGINRGADPDDGFWTRS